MFPHICAFCHFEDIGYLTIHPISVNSEANLPALNASPFQLRTSEPFPLQLLGPRVGHLKMCLNGYWLFCSVFLKYIYLFIYFWVCWVFVAVHGLSLVAVSGGYSSLRCSGLSLQWPLPSRSMGSRRTGFSSCGTRALEPRLSSCGTRA